MAKFYKPQNEKGHDLVSVKDQYTGSDKIHKSWLNTVSGVIDSSEAGTNDDDFVLGSAVTATLAELRKDLSSIKFDASHNTLEALDTYYKGEIASADNDKLETIRQTLNSTIFFVKASNEVTNDTKAEYICINASSVKSDTDPVWEKIGETAQAAGQATDDTLGLVKLTDTIDDSDDVEEGIAATPKAVADHVTSAIADAIADKLDSVSLTVGNTTITLDSGDSAVAIQGSDAITVTATAAANNKTVTITANAASEDVAGVVQLTSDIDDDTDDTKAVTPKGVKEYVDAKFEAEGIDEKISGAIEEALEEDGAIKNAIDSAKEELQGKIDELEEKVSKTEIVSREETITAGKVTINITAKKEEFVSAFINSKLFIPEVEVSSTAITITFCDENDTTTQGELGTKAKILISQLVSDDDNA